MANNRKTPQVSTGVRTAMDAPAFSQVMPEKDGSFTDPSIQEMRERITRPLEIPKLKATTFRSVKSGYRLQITSPADTWDPATGKKTTARPIFAQFRDHEMVLSHDKEFNRKLIAAMKRSKGFGSDFFDASDVAIKAQEASFQALVGMIDGSDPKLGLKSRLLKTLAGQPDEFPVPAKNEPVPEEQDENPALDLENGALADAAAQTEGL